MLLTYFSPTRTALRGFELAAGASWPYFSVVRSPMTLGRLLSEA